MTKDKILFFASGDFAIDTFESLIDNGFDVVGLVTSTDKVAFHDNRICDVASMHGVPVYTLKNGIPMEDDEFLLDWLRRANADIYCVISFKKIPSQIIKLAKKCAFNIHASLLPFLRGSAPINWAVRLGYKETGLTAFVLDDKIDHGDIIANVKVKISNNEKFTTLHKKLSDACVDFTKHVINDILQNEGWRDNLLVQPSWNEQTEYLVKAHKINSEYFRVHWTRFTAKRLKNLVNSVDDTGLPCIIITEVKKGQEKRFNAKIFDVELVDNDENRTKSCESDGKTYIRLNFYEGNESLLVKKIQLSGKKIMNVEEFLNGFRYFRENDSTVITDLMSDIV